MKRVYMHQTRPRLVDAVRDMLIRTAGAKSEQLPKNSHLYGNLVAPATLKLLDDDIASGVVAAGDRVCFPVVGAGPERGCFMTSLSN